MVRCNLQLRREGTTRPARGDNTPEGKPPGERGQHARREGTTRPARGDNTPGERGQHARREGTTRPARGENTPGERGQHARREKEVTASVEDVMRYNLGGQR
ncbi:hypothetical protein KUCAC02_036781 [Chaenocephalus aceratus]|nr:hypothetical protein KUCAC02_036781 [Chaenocephalus aceratus]